MKYLVSSIKMNNVYKGLIFVALLFILNTKYQILNTRAVYAAAPQQSLRVTPIINDLTLVPGKQTNFTLTIENISTNPVGIHAEINGSDILGDAPQDSQKSSPIVTWTSLSSNDLLLGGKQKKTIVVVISTPLHTSQNGFYETIFLTPILHQEQTTNAPIILSRIGVLVLGTVGNLNYQDLAKKAFITHITPSKKIVNKFPQDISFTVANKYFSHFDAKPFVTITPLFANSQTVELTDKHILPGSARIWHYQAQVPKNHIFYQMHLAVSVGGGKQIVADTWFVVLPYQQVLLVIFILLLLYITIARRKRLGKFVKVLVKG